MVACRDQHHGMVTGTAEHCVLLCYAMLFYVGGSVIILGLSFDRETRGLVRAAVTVNGAASFPQESSSSPNVDPILLS